MEIKIDRKIFHIAGDRNLAECIKANESDGFRLDRIIWTGNLEAKAPGQILTPQGEDMKTGLIHLYLVIFLREVPEPASPKLIN